MVTRLKAVLMQICEREVPIGSNVGARLRSGELFVSRTGTCASALNYGGFARGTRAPTVRPINDCEAFPARGRFGPTIGRLNDSIRQSEFSHPALFKVS